eukprot:1726704-Rhodomonas_salina.1
MKQRVSPRSNEGGSNSRHSGSSNETFAASGPAMQTEEIEELLESLTTTALQEASKGRENDQVFRKIQSQLSRSLGLIRSIYQITSGSDQEGGCPVGMHCWCIHIQSLIVSIRDACSEAHIMPAVFTRYPSSRLVRFCNRLGNHGNQGGCRASSGRREPLGVNRTHDVLGPAKQKDPRNQPSVSGSLHAGELWTARRVCVRVQRKSNAV